MTEIHPDVTWINECFSIDGKHQHVAVYLIHDRDTGQFVLVDSGSFYHREGIVTEVAEATDGAGVDALILSHSDYPHSGNVDEFVDPGGETKLVASSGSPRAQGLPADARKAEIGGSLSVAGREFSFIDPPLADRSHTTWIYDHDSGGLFVADGFGSYHEPGQCDATSTDLEDGVPEEMIYEFHRDTLVWLRYVDPAKIRATLDDIFAEYDPMYVAPIHGHPILEDDLDDYVDALVDAAARIADEYSVLEP